MKWNKWGFRPPLWTYRLNRARRTSWGWWDRWDDTALQTQDLKFEHLRSESKHATSRSRRLPTILNIYEWAGKKYFCFFETCRPEWGSNPRSPFWGLRTVWHIYPYPPFLLTFTCDAVALKSFLTFTFTHATSAGAYSVHITRVTGTGIHDWNIEKRSFKYYTPRIIHSICVLGIVAYDILAWQSGEVHRGV